MLLTQGQVQTIAAAVGMKDPKTMAAIAMAESKVKQGGTWYANTNAHNAQPPDDSYGLWQINMLGDMGAARRKTFGISKNADLYNPLINARAAKMIQSSQGLGAWSTYTSGAYRDFMGKADAVQAGWWDDFKKGFKEGWDVGPGPEDPEFREGFEEGFDVGPGPEDLGSLVRLGDIFAKAGDWVSDPSKWVRVLYVVGGAALVIGGLVLVARPLLESAAASTPVGTVAKFAKGAAK